MSLYAQNTPSQNSGTQLKHQNTCLLDFSLRFNVNLKCSLNLLTYSMVQSPSWEDNWFAASQEIPRISRNPKVHYRTHKRPPPFSILDQPNPVHISTSHLLEIHPNIIHTCLKKYTYLLTYLLTHLLTPWRRVLLEKLTGLQLVKKFAAFHGTWKFITALTSVRHLALSWASPIQSIYLHSTSWRSILILSTHVLKNILTYLLTYSLTYLLHGAESFLRS